MAVNPNNPFASFGSNQFSPIARPPRDESLRKLMDPTGFLSELAKLKEPAAGGSTMPKKKPQQQAAVMQPPPASTTPPSTTTPPASTTPTTPAAPAPTPRTNPPVYKNTGSVSDTMWKDQSDAAKLTFAQDPLAANAGNNLRRELGRIAAEESFARRDAESRARYRQANLDREAARAARPKSTYTTQTAPAVKPVSLPMGTPPQMGFGNGAAPNPLVVTPDVPKLVQSTPTGKLAEIAAPSEYNYRTPRGEFVGPLDFEARPLAVTGVGSGTTGQPIEPQGRPWSPSQDQQAESLRRAIAARDEQAAFTNPRVTLPTIDPVTAQAMSDVDKRDAANRFNILPEWLVGSSKPDMRDPAVFKNYMQDVEARRRQLAGAGAQEVGAPLQLTDNGRVGAGEAAWESLKGLVGPEIPPELRQRELDTATTTRARDLAEIGQYNDATKQATLDALVAGEMGTRRPSGGPAGNTSPSVVDRRNEPGAPVDERIHTMTPNASQAQEISQHMIENPDAGKGIGVQQRRPYSYTAPDFRTSTAEMSPAEVSQHMIENPDAGKGIGVQQRRATPSPYESYSYKPSPVEEFLDTLDRIKNPNREPVGNVRRPNRPYGETGFDPSTGQGYLPINFEQADARAPHPSRIGMTVTGTPLPPEELTPEARRLREDIPFTPRDNVPGQMSFDDLRTQRSDERVAELRSADRKYDANDSQRARADKAIAELAKAGFFGSDNPSPVKPHPPTSPPKQPETLVETATGKNMEQRIEEARQKIRAGLLDPREAVQGLLKVGEDALNSPTAVKLFELLGDKPQPKGKK